MRPFDGVRVLELGTGIALAFCGKIFADFGAEVIKVEAPGGDPLRRMPPLADVGDGPPDSGYFAWLNTNKSSLVADLADATDAERVARLARDADIVLDARDIDKWSEGPLGHDALRSASPGLIITAISWFGEDGPYHRYAATDATARALAGVIKGVGPVEGPPLLPHDNQSGLLAGLASFIPTAASYLAAGDGGRRISVDQHEALALIVELDISYALQGTARPRSGVNRFGRHYPASIYRASDGWIGISTVTPAQWRGLCVVLGVPEIASDPRYATSAGRLARSDELDALLEPLFQRKAAAEWFEIGRANRLPLVIVPTMDQLLRQEIHRERGAFVPVKIGTASFEGPVLCHRLDAESPRAGGRAPVLGEGTSSWREGTSVRKAGPRRADPDALPLRGVRIVDLTMGWAGPFAARHLADLGADIIKVESCRYFDWYRGTDESEAFRQSRQYEKNLTFNLMNRNKRGITLDLTTEEGKVILKDLVASADGVIENYSAEVLPKLGLDYHVLNDVRPDLVMVSMAAFGAGNAWSKTRAYGGTLEQASGLPVVSGHESWPPTMTTYAHGDPVGGYNGAVAMLLGLIRRQRTGAGGWINMSQIEGMLSLVAPSIVEQSLFGRVAPRAGNRHPLFAPQNVYRSAGDDGWVAVSIRSDAEWARFADLTGQPNLSSDPRFATAEARRAHSDAADEAVGAWMTSRSADVAMQQLQAAGIPAGVARSTTELIADPHLNARGWWQRCDRAISGPHLTVGPTYRIEGRAPPIRWPAPTLGEFTDEVLASVLGFDEARLRQLRAQGITGLEAA
jgi:crotonobetainyl-CoA:carnitine CoA-transferase CaiB-like acyl-CoA transferase